PKSALQRSAVARHAITQSKGFLMSTDKFQTYIALVVEDDASGLAILSVMLRRIGVRTVMERYASAAIDRAKQMTKVDMIFLDLGLPDGDGYEVLAQLKKEAGLKNV